MQAGTNAEPQILHEYHKDIFYTEDNLPGFLSEMTRDMFISRLADKQNKSSQLLILFLIYQVYWQT